MTRQIFVNLPIRDLKATQAFFGKLGFEFNPKFSDDKAACMIINEHAYVMLLTEPFFKTFTKRELFDATKQTEALLCVSCPSRAAVDEMIKTALASGGKPAMPPQDMTFMYNGSFYDLDGHHWEVMWMDPAAAQ